MTKISKFQKMTIIEGMRKYDEYYKKEYEDTEYDDVCIMNDDEDMFCFIDGNGYIFIDVKNDLIGFGWCLDNAIKNGLDDESLEYLIEFTSGWED